MKKICLSLVCLGLSTAAFAGINTESASSASNSTAESTTTKATEPSNMPESATKITSGVFISVTPCETSSPCGVVGNTSKRVLEAVNKGVSQTQTMSLIQEVVIPQFDFALMTKYALGNNWESATPAQQQQLVDLFKQLLIYTYSTALSKFKGAQITITKSNIINDKKAEVVSQVILPNSTTNAQPVQVEYDLAKTSANNAWKAYDIKIENASLVTTYRNQFNEVVQSNKIEGLIKQLQNKVSSLKTKSV